jgi:hypothetical protein
MRPLGLILHTFFLIIFVGRIILEIKYVNRHAIFSIIGSLPLLCVQYSIEGEKIFKVYLRSKILFWGVRKPH